MGDERPPFDVTGPGAPRSIGPYAILGVLGRGGMGVVYRGEHQETGELVAVKTVRTPVETALASIRREIHALWRLRHPGIVRIVAQGIADGLPWYAMQLLEDSTLRDCLRDAWRRPDAERATTTVEVSSTQPAEVAEYAGAPPSPRPRRAAPTLPWLLSLMRRICAPLAFLHGSGLVHRDLKPDNILVRDDGRPVLVDLGIAALFGGGRGRGREELEADDKVMGSIHYMAPEQIRGELVDARADLYALGCILYECVTGRPPFTGSLGTSVLYQQLFEQPVPPSQQTAGVPPALDRLILQLLKKRPQDRLGYADDVAAALGAMGVEGAPDVEPRAPAYLYRPDFTGRTEAMATLGAALGHLESGARGGLVLIRGESGVGKTRLSMEMARAAVRGAPTILTGHCAAHAGGATPLLPLRPLLLAIADRCAEGGPAVVARLLGRRAKVLAAYEPALLGLPDVAALAEPSVLAPDAARARVIDAFKSALFALAEITRVVFVIDDLQWADELTLSCLSALGADDLSARAVLVVGTYRMEETRPELEALAQSAQATTLTLERLDAPSVGAMVSGMLALHEPPAKLLDFLMNRSNGNPFFVAEYLHAAIAEGMLARDGAGRWQFNERGVTAAALLALPLPETLSALFDRRLGGLDDDGRALLAWAAVLGRELEGDLLASAEDTAAMEAIEALRVRQILEEGRGRAAPLRPRQDPRDRLRAAPPPRSAARCTGGRATPSRRARPTIPTPPPASATTSPRPRSTTGPAGTSCARPIGPASGTPTARR